MKRSRFTDSQIMAARRRVEVGLPVPEIFRELGVSSVTFDKWRAKFGGMDTPMMARMRELEDENEQIANWLIRLTDNNRSWVFGLCYLYLRNVKSFG